MIKATEAPMFIFRHRCDTMMDSTARMDLEHNLHIKDTKHTPKKALHLQGIKAALFDMDGTMVDNNIYHKKAWEKFAARHGFSLTEQDFRLKVSGKQNKQILPHLLGRHISDDDLQALADEKEQIYRDIYAPHLVPIRGLHALIKEFKARRIKVAVATMAQETNRTFVLDALGLQNHFDAVLDEKNFTYGKPNPDIFIKTATTLAVKPAQCIVFEDTPSGIQAARRAGMKPIGLLTFYTKDELKEADFVIEDFSGLTLCDHCYYFHDH